MTHLIRSVHQRSTAMLPSFLEKRQEEGEDKKYNPERFLRIIEWDCFEKIQSASRVRYAHRWSRRWVPLSG